MVTLPSKKVLSVFILTAALVAAVIIAFGRDKSTSAINYASNLVAGEKVSIPENANWQNELGGVSQNTTLAQTEETTSSSETVTDTVSKTLISNYLALKQSGKLDQTSTQKLVDQTVNYIGKSENINIEIPKLNIIPDNGKQTTTDYGERLGMILKTNRPESIKKAFSVLQEGIIGKDPRKMEELQKTIDIYGKMADEMAKMPVPKTFVKAHTDMVIGMRAIILGLKEMKGVLNDPFTGLQGVKLFQQGSSIFIKATIATMDFIKQNGIDYKQGSGGYYLLYGI